MFVWSHPAVIARAIYPFIAFKSLIVSRLQWKLQLNEYNNNKVSTGTVVLIQEMLNETPANVRLQWISNLLALA